MTLNLSSDWNHHVRNAPAVDHWYRVEFHGPTCPDDCCDAGVLYLTESVPLRRGGTSYHFQDGSAFRDDDENCIEFYREGSHHGF